MIEAHSLSRRFGPTLAVDGLDLHVAAGEIFCLLGPNGAGKTTTLRMLTGLLRPSSGSACIGGFDMVEAPLRAKALLGYVPDRPHLYDRLTGRELLVFVGGLYGLDEAVCTDRAKTLLDAYGLRDKADELVGSYSHGMRQKLAFATCFLHAPKAVVIDEPWVGLDPRSLRRIKDDLRRRAGDGLAVLMSTHSLSIAEELADRVGIVHRGRLRHTGSVAAIKRLAVGGSLDDRGPLDDRGSLETVFLELTAEGDDPAEADR